MVSQNCLWIQFFTYRNRLRDFSGDAALYLGVFCLISCIIFYFMQIPTRLTSTAVELRGSSTMATATCSSTLRMGESPSTTPKTSVVLAGDTWRPFIPKKNIIS